MEYATARAPKTLFAETADEYNRLSQKALELPRINLTDRQLNDLEQLMVGGFSPLSGFMEHDDYVRVVDQMRLTDGSVFPMPIVLDVPVHEGYDAGQELVLCDQYGTPLAIMEVTSAYRPDKHEEAQKVYGTTDKTHPGVRYLFEDTQELYLGGPVRGLMMPTRYDFAELRATPQQLHAWFQRNGIERVVGFQTRNPVHRHHYELLARAAREHDAHVLLHPVVGVTKEGDIDYVTRVRAYRRLYQERMQSWATLSLLQLAMRMAGPREAVWHALVRRNYGCTHFIVGREHAAPGDGFYGPYDAHELVKAFAPEIGIEPVLSKEVVYVPQEDTYKSRDELRDGEQVEKLSGTEVRRRLSTGEEIPSWFSFPEVLEELRRGAEKRANRGLTLFFTGLSGAGKSTIAHILRTKLIEVQDKDITMLDGDVVRQHLSKGLGFSEEDRNANIERIGFVAGEVTKHGGIAICSAIAPYAAAREKNRNRIQQLGNYIEIYVSTPLETCQARDPKGLYQKVAAGDITGFTGVDDPYEQPNDAEITIDTRQLQPAQAADQILEYLRHHQLI
jgi:sulfate adenylyltransferase